MLVQWPVIHWSFPGFRSPQINGAHQITAVAAWISGSLPQSPWISGFRGFKNICKISWTPCITDGGLFSKHHTTQYKGHLVTLHRFGCRLSAERAWITPTPSRLIFPWKKRWQPIPNSGFLCVWHTPKKTEELEDGLHKDQLNIANSEQCIKFGHLLRPAAMSNPLSGCHASRVFAMPPKKLGLIPDGLTMSIQNCIVSKQVTITNKWNE